MVTSLVVLADIHGVLPALDAVLEEPLVRAADALVLAGDHCAGPLPVPTLERLRGLGEKVLWVRGNADRELVTIARGGGTTIEDPIAGWAGRQLQPGHVQFLDALPPRQVVQVDGLGPVLVCHATPRDDEEVVLVDSSVSRWTEVLGGLPDDVRTVVLGHTHMPFLRTIEGRTVLNPGSVGMPYGNRGAHWASLADGEVTLHRTDFDYAGACEQLVAESTYPDVAAWADEYVWARNSDVDALTVFGPRDGR